MKKYILRIRNINSIGNKNVKKTEYLACKNDHLVEKS